jgi:hypothetical protein
MGCNRNGCSKEGLVRLKVGMPRKLKLSLVTGDWRVEMSEVVFWYFLVFFGVFLGDVVDFFLFFVAIFWLLFSCHCYFDRFNGL